MIDSFFNLATELNIKYKTSLRKELHNIDNGEEALIKKLESELENTLFSYRFISGQISEHTVIKRPFVVNVGKDYFLIKYSNGVYYDHKGNTTIDKYLGCRFFELREVVKKISPQDIVSEIINFTPVWSLFLLLLTPLALVTPLYTNIFNTRLVYSSSIMTLLIVSVFFFGVYILEFLAKKVIKNKCLQVNSESGILFERYILKFTPYYRGFASIHSAKTVEQYRKSIWDFIPSIASDSLSFIILFIALSVFVSWYSIYFFIFYAFVFSIFYLYRSRLYQHLIERENASSDVLKLKISNSLSRNNIPYVNKYILYEKYLNTFRGAQYSEDKITNFNFYWDELTRMVSFFALTVLFAISFAGISNSELNPAYMIVLFIISSRLSGLMTQIATRLSYLKASLYHINQSMETLYDAEIVPDRIDDLGVKIESLDKIKISGLSIKEDQHLLLNNVNMKLNKGILYGIKGPVGSGKSTFFRTIIGLNKNFKGKIEYDGVDLNVIDSSFFEMKVSYLTAETDFFSGTLYDNFLFRNCVSNKLIESILKECFGNRVFDYQSLYVNDIESIPMSTGQRRKLLFMLSLLDKSELYVFDEVLVNLSKPDIVRAVNMLRKFIDESIIIISSHNESILSACDVVYDIAHHTIIEVKNDE